MSRTSTPRRTPKIVLAGLLLLVAAGAQAQKFVVDTTDDENDTNQGDRICETISGTCSLRAALEEAAQLPGPHRVIVPSGYYLLRLIRLPVDGQISVEGERKDPPVISSQLPGEPVFRIGPGATNARLTDIHINKCGANGIRVVHTQGLELTRVTVSGCVGSGINLWSDSSVRISNVEIRDNEFTGVVVNNGATLTGDNLRILRNRGAGAGGLGAGANSRVELRESTFRGNQGGWVGGGVTSSATLILSDSVIAENTSRVFGGGLYYLSSATGGNSRLELNNVVFTGNSSTEAGGGAWICGEAVIRNSGFLGNTAGSGGALSLACSYPVMLQNSVVRGNSANRFGGGFHTAAAGADVTLTRSQFTGNAAVNSGGALYLNSAASVVVEQVTVAGNSATSGAGIHAAFLDSLTMVSSTVHSNRASANGGGLLVQQNGVNSPGAILIDNSTFSGNSAGSMGGNVHADHLYQPLTLQHTTLVDGVASGGSAISMLAMSAELILRRSIIGGTQAAQSCVLDHTRVQRDDFNLFSHNNDCIGPDPYHTDYASTRELELGPLANNGGGTATHLPVYGGRVTNMVTENCSGNDQRGVSRDSPYCETGAVEYPGI